MNLEDKIYNIIKNDLRIKQGSKVICALSGGADSTCLCRILGSLAKKLEISVVASHVNHCIRGDESDRDEAFARDLANSIGIPFYSVRIDVPSLSEGTSLGIEECARNARYEYLEQLADNIGAQFIATAHNANDNLETAIFNLTRGSGINGISGIPLRRRSNNIEFIRPLLYTSRDEIEEYLSEINQNFVVDSTNLSDEYTRNHIRHNVITLLKEINPSVVNTFKNSSRLLSLQEDHLRAEADKAYADIKTGSSISIPRLLALHPALRGEVINRSYREVSGPGSEQLGWSHIDLILKICTGSNPSAVYSLPGAVAARREYDKLVIERTDNVCSLSDPVELIDGGSILFNGFTVSIRKTNTINASYRSLHNFFVDCSKIYGKLIMRTRLPGDEIHLAGHTHKARLKKLMIDRKIPRSLRDILPVIADDSGVVAVDLLGVADRVKVDPNSRELYNITIDKQ